MERGDEALIGFSMPLTLRLLGLVGVILFAMLSADIAAQAQQPRSRTGTF
jgi:hypothetical protein